MALIIPDFKGTQCLGIFAWGEIIKDKPETLAIVEKMSGRSLLANYKAADGSESMLILDLGGESGWHVRLGAFKQDLYPFEGNGGTIALDELIAHFNLLSEQQISGGFYGRFVLPIEELPKNGIVSSTMFEREEQEISIKINAAQFEIQGAPVNWLDWALIDEDRKIMIDLGGVLSEMIGDHILIKQLDFIDSAFRIFVRGGK